ncbi:hypothetical protein [Bacillus thuringiensis]|nr:hypothetical protein [Bacillus thuringiensis]
MNTFYTLCVNRMPQFRLPGYQILLLPLYAQAANIHSDFLKDVIGTYSTYCNTTYHTDFIRKFSEDLTQPLNYRTFMILNVLDYVSLWARDSKWNYS